MNRRQYSFDDTLNDRELEVLRLLAQDLTDKAIARQLGITQSSVTHAIRRVRERTGLETAGRVGLARFYWTTYERGPE